MAMKMELLQSGLEEYLRECPEVVAVYLFGSQAEGLSHARSDLDLAVLLGADVDKERYTDYRLKLLEELSGLLPNRLDLIILNQVPPLFQFQVLQKGRLLFDRDPGLRAKLEMHMLNRYYDMRRYYEFHFKHLTEKIKGRGLGHGRARDPSQAQKA